jgi:hypothetical protein
MKKVLFLLNLLPFYLNAQVVCTPGSNVVLFTNYDGGILNINVDMDIPNLKIGIVSYEAVQINFSGPFVNNITEARYAGYNSSNNNCGQSITTTIFSGLSAGAATSITFAPPSPISDPNGNNSIICGYSCNSSSNQGGCNTSDQIVAYFYQVFNVNAIYSHRIQYGCWSGTQNISAGGNCCSLLPPPPPPLTSTATGINNSCASSCNGTATANPVGGSSPYTYAWGANANNVTTQTVTDLCPGTYSVTITDALGAQSTSSVTISAPPAIEVVGIITEPLCFGEFGSIQLNTSGGVAPYAVNWNGLNPLEIPAGSFAISIQDANNCVFNYTFNVSEPSEIIGNMIIVPDLGNCEGSISIDVQGGTSPYSYSWVGLPEVSSEIMNLCGGEFCVEVTDFNGCEEEFCGTVANLANIEESNISLFDIVIVPNPSTDGAMLAIESLIAQPLVITIVDAVGRAIFTKVIHTNTSSQIDISMDEPRGVYFIHITSDTGHIETLRWVRN